MMDSGAQALLRTLIDAGIEVCFANPGTSEMHLVSAIGKTDAVRPILCLFEGVATGAADGYARMTDRPALTLLHLGSGFSNGMANLHNARKAHVPLVNIVGDHATYHLPYNAPLTSDVPAHARLASEWVRVSVSADDLAACGALAVAASLGGAGRIATVVAPANHAWETAARSHAPIAAEPAAAVAPATIETVARVLRSGTPSALLLGGRALRADCLAAAGCIAEATGARLLSETFPARMQRGSGHVRVERIPYFAEHAIGFLRPFEHLVLVGAQTPVAFFAYPDTPSLLAPAHCAVDTLADVHEDIPDALAALAAAVGAAAQPTCLQPRSVPQPPQGALTPAAMGETISGLLPLDAIVADEGITCALELFDRTTGAAAHDWLATTGGAIGQGMPVALGAAVACPARKVVALQADGGAMYTVQTLWTLCREQADVTVVLLNNRSYAILNIELARVHADRPNHKTLSMLDLDNPPLDWVSIARGMGVPATRASTAEEFHVQFGAAMRAPGPRLIEAVVAQDLGDIFGDRHGGAP